MTTVVIGTVTFVWPKQFAKLPYPRHRSIANVPYQSQGPAGTEHPGELFKHRGSRKPVESLGADDSVRAVGIEGQPLGRGVHDHQVG